MARHTARIGTLTIPQSGSNSEALTSLERGRSGLGLAIGLTIYAPSALTGTVTVEVLPFGDTTWRTLQSAGVDVAIAAGKAVVISPPAFADLRLHSSGVEAAARAFFVDAQVDAGY